MVVGVRGATTVVAVLIRTLLTGHASPFRPPAAPLGALPLFALPLHQPDAHTHVRRAAPRTQSPSGSWPRRHRSDSYRASTCPLTDTLATPGSTIARGRWRARRRSTS